MIKSINKEGYEQISLKLKDGRLKTFLVHRLMAMSFLVVRHIDKKLVNHKKPIKTMNNIGNLEWTDESGNMKHASVNGLLLDQKGSNNNFAKINEDDAHNICKLIERYYNNNEISKIMNISIEIVRTIREKRAWVHISSVYNMMYIKSLNMSDIDNRIIMEVEDLLKNKKDKYFISNKLSIGKRAVEVIKREL